MASASTSKGRTIPVAPPRGARERTTMLRILASVFGFGEGRDVVWANSVGHGNLRVVHAPDGTVAGGMARMPAGMWLGGRDVPCHCVAAVGIAPEHRASGAGSRLMRETVLESAREGTALCALFPATTPVYRRVGYEHAGSLARYFMNPALFPTSHGPATLRAGTKRDLPRMRALRDRWARARSGWLRRDDHLHRRATGMPGQKVECCVIEEGRTMTGYLVLVRTARSGGSHEIVLTDHAFDTPAAGRRILSFLASHRSMVEKVTWDGSPQDALAGLIEDGTPKVERLWRWMVRIADLRAALSARGYPGAVTADVSLDVDDDLVASNRGRWRLRVAGGRGRVTKGGDGAVRLDIRALASIYTGFRNPAEAVAAGLFVEGPAADLAALAACFAGPAPCTGEMF